jgi:ATP-dependent DNA helicase HFM1/MER3
LTAICAPTGSGKTVVLELAIIRLLINFESNGTQMNALKVIYMAPLKVLVNEKFKDWNNKFQYLGVKCVVMTGDSDIEDYEQLRNANIVLTTPEKWDSLTRNNENKSLVRSVQLMLIDEIHLIHDGSRGATMEAVISRMKTLRSVMLKTGNGPHLRFLAVSATAPNVEDIAQWLDPYFSIGYKMSNDLRPVRLRKIVLGYNCKQTWNDFQFDMQLSYRLDSVIKTYSESKPTLIFCSTRKNVEFSATHLSSKSSINFFFGQNQRFDLLRTIENRVKSNDLRNSLQKGIGFHHSGLDANDRHLVENLFSDGKLPVLISTTTLSMGVNLPAHLVVIKGTTQFAANSNHEYPETQILQMMGRAGRPQFDASATAVIMTKEQNKRKYEDLINGLQKIESNLHKNLVEHLNAEIAMETITSFGIAVDWIRSTFLYIRVLKNPQYYGSDGSKSGEEEMTQLVEEWCLKELIGLRNSNMIVASDHLFSDIRSTELGKLMAKYCISLKTMKKLIEMIEKEISLKEMIAEISKCDEIVQEVQLRVNEKKKLNEMNQSSTQNTIRFPISGRIKAVEMKVNCLIQAIFGSLNIQETSLTQDSNKIMKSGLRVAKCLVEIIYMSVGDKKKKVNYKTLLNSVILYKCFKAKLWHDSPHVAKQLKGIGVKLSTALVDKNITSFNDIKNTNPRDIEFCLKRGPPFGTQLVDEVFLFLITSLLTMKL